MAEITQTINTVTILPTPPNPNSPSTFDALAYPYTVAQNAFGVDVNDMATELNTFATQTNAVKDEVNTAKNTAVSSANTAITKASEASASATSAYNAQLAAEVALDKFNDRYLGAKTTPPIVDNSGDPLQGGTMYYNSVSDTMFVWDAELLSWIPVFFTPTDHGGLTGLGDDDHTQYHNDARGDARYYTQSENDILLSAKVNTSDLTELTQDTIGSSIVAGNDITVTYNDTTGLTEVAFSGVLETAAIGDIVYRTEKPTDGTWLECNGSKFLQADYPSLWSKIKNNFLTFYYYFNNTVSNVFSTVSTITISGKSGHLEASNLYNTSLSINNNIEYYAGNIGDAANKIRYRTNYDTATSNGTYDFTLIPWMITRNVTGYFFVTANTENIYKSSGSAYNSGYGAYSNVYSIPYTNVSYKNIQGQATDGTITIFITAEGRVVTHTEAGGFVDRGYAISGSAYDGIATNLVYANGKFLASHLYKAYESTDGVTWSSKPSQSFYSTVNAGAKIFDKAAQQWYSYGSSVFRLFKLNTDNTWSEIVMSRMWFPATWSAITLSVVGGAFIATCSTDNIVYISYDRGKTWKQWTIMPDAGVLKAKFFLWGDGSGGEVYWNTQQATTYYGGILDISFDVNLLTSFKVPSAGIHLSSVGNLIPFIKAI